MDNDLDGPWSINKKPCYPLVYVLINFMHFAANSYSGIHPGDEADKVQYAVVMVSEALSTSSLNERDME